MTNRVTSIQYWLVLLLGMMLFETRLVYAMPSFARQTGYACNQCHINSFGPKLNSIGRLFKLTGYTLSNAALPRVRSSDEPATPPPTRSDWKFPPLSAMVVAPSFTHANKDVPDPSSPFSKNNNLTADELSLFYAGKIFTSEVVNAGAFIQVTYEPLADAIAWDNADVRFTRDVNLNLGGDHAVALGVSLNNNPTVQDLWNTTPAWGFPFAGTPVEDLPAPPGEASPLISNLGQTVGGATAFAMIDDVIPNTEWNGYVEAGAYANLSPTTQRTFGVLGSDTANQIDGGAPYWRVALEHEFPHAYLEVGHYGFAADIFPGRDHSAGRDHYTDLALDATFTYYPFEEHTHNFQLWGTVIWEDQHLSASQALGLTGNRNSTLTTYNITGSYTYIQTYQLNLGYFSSHGSADPVLWTNPSGNPDSDGVIVEFDYTPFGKTNSLWAPYLNARFAVQYTAFTTFLGRSSNYDGSGRNASDNDTLFLNAWFAF